MSPPARVFVGGCERSGTTFLAARISRWAGLVFLPESYFLLPVLRQLDKGISARKLILANWRVETFGLERQVMADRLRDDMNPRECMDALAELYADKIGQKASRGWVEHTPFNTANVPLLDRHFEDTRYINVVRDGRAVAASILKTDFGPTTSARAAVWWQSSTLPGVLAHVAEPHRVLLVRYEDLIRDEEACRQRVLAFLGIEKPAAEGEVPLRVDPYFRTTHRLVSGSAESSRINAWRKELSAREIEDFEFTAGSSLHALGYELVHDGRPRERRYYRYIDAIVDAFLSLFWQVPRRVLRRYLSRLRRR